MAGKVNNKILTEKFSEAASTKGERIHIVSGREGWAVKNEGFKRASAIKKIKREAIRVAKKIKPLGEIYRH
ncbi:MAG: DUF2188 domain-containing protein [Bacteroidales bacterium]|nr:DUF2188 domain-containing protein [Bacteroidales bacterium]